MNTTSSIDREIQDLESQLQDSYEKLVELKRQRSNNEVVRDYELHNWQGGTTKLSELFGDKKELIVVHNMGIACNYCTLWADGLNGFAKPLNDRAAFVLVSPDSPETQMEVASGRDWNFQMLSTKDLPFVSDMGFSSVQEGRNYFQPGYSTFQLHDDGTITRTAYDTFGPGDLYCSPWHMFGLLANGINDWQPKKNYS